MTDVEVSNFCSYLCFKISISLFFYEVAYPGASTFKNLFYLMFNHTELLVLFTVLYYKEIDQ